MQNCIGYLCILIIVLASCSDGATPQQKSTDTNAMQPPVDTTAPKNELVPGERLGSITIGLDADSIEPRLGMPDVSDAAMGKAWLTWKSKGKPYVLNIYTTYKDTSMSVKTVQQIRTTSPYFKTGTGLHVGSTLPQLNAAFPALQRTAVYIEASGKYELYDAVAAGIAFEMKAGVCTGILVHPKGQRADAIYIMLHPDMKRL